VVEENYEQAKLLVDIADLNAPAQGDQTRFEQLFLTIVVDILSRTEGNSEILIECRQKDEFAQVTILKGQFAFSPETMGQIDRIASETADFKGRLQVSAQGNGVEVVLKIPLQFQTVKLTVVPNQKEPTPKAV
jgi:hypothetical protein